MPIAAVPAYLGNDFRDASPGLRFGMYLKIWGVNRRTHTLLWQTHDIDYKVSGQQQQEREYKDENKVRALREATTLSKRDKDAMHALALRQSAQAATVVPDNLLRLEALATAPFTTGLGNEHPLENGFAFLNPYGLPYLPGSGVKGVMRQAARELASGDWGESHGWDAAAIDAFFGKEDSNEAQRGALAFWDVIPQIKGDSLSVEIMTPHQGHYYQQKAGAGSTSPHDSGQPIPISYLTVPAQSGFAFHVVCDTNFLSRLAPGLVGTWKTLLAAAFEHAFQWLGFGAKTAVGYGAMESNAMRENRKQAEEARKEAAKAEADQLKAIRQEAEAEPWAGARLKFNRANKALTAEKSGKTATAIAPQGEALLASLPADIRRKVETNQFVKVTAYVAGSTLIRVEP